MQAVLEFPSKIFIQWGAIAQEIVPYLAQRGVRREEICAVVERLRARWEQLDSAPSGPGTEIETPDVPDTAQVPGSLEERAMNVSRHWRSQPARTLIESALDDYQRHTRC